MRCLEVPAAPGRETQECRSRSAPELVVFGGEVERPPGMLTVLGQIAPDQGVAGTVHGDRTWQTAEFLVVDDDHLRRLSSGR